MIMMHLLGKKGPSGPMCIRPFSPIILAMVRGLCGEESQISVTNFGLLPWGPSILEKILKKHQKQKMGRLIHRALFLSGNL
jgi:hypothetical protein